MRWWAAVTAGWVLAAVEEYAAVRPMAWVLRPPVSVVVTVVLFVLLVHGRLYGDGERIGLARRAVPARQSLCRLSSCSLRSGWASGRAKGEQRDLARREDPQRWSPETGAPARVELGPLTVPAEALDDRLVEAHQVVGRPDLAAVSVPGDLQVDAVCDGPSTCFGWWASSITGSKGSAPARAAAWSAWWLLSPDAAAVRSSTPATTNRAPPRSTTTWRLCSASQPSSRMHSSQPCASPKYSWLPVTYARASLARTSPSGAASFEARGTPPPTFYPEVIITFDLDSAAQHYYRVAIR
jgi:hypothetical protein